MIRLVLTLVEFVRQLLERQAVRRVKEQTLNAEEIERLGTALMRLEATVHELADCHGIERLRSESRSWSARHTAMSDETSDERSQGQR